MNTPRPARKLFRLLPLLTFLLLAYAIFLAPRRSFKKGGGTCPKSCLSKGCIADPEAEAEADKYAGMTPKQRREAIARDLLER